MSDLCRAVLRGLCRLHGWDTRTIEDMAAGRKPVSPEVAELFSKLLGVPLKAWPIPPSVVSAAVSRYSNPVTEYDRRAILRANGRRRRTLATPVHDVLDRLDWSIADLTAHVSQRMRKRVSRASMQFWATGTRQVGPAGQSRSHAVQAPLEVRVAAEKVTARVAMRLGLGEEAILLRGKWPNVEPE